MTSTDCAKLGEDPIPTADRLRRAQELGGAVPYEWNFRSNDLLAPAALGSLYGLGPVEELTYDAVVARIHPEDREAASNAHRHAVQAGGRYEQEYRVLLPDDSIRWLLVRGEATRDDFGDPFGLAGVAMDITDRKKLELAVCNRERELAERNRFISNVLSSSDDCIKVLDLDANLVFMSEGGMRVMEVDDFGKIDGCSWPAFWHGKAADEARTALDDARSGGTGRFEGPCPTLAGNPRWWDVVVTAILDEKGRPEKLLSISRDITNRKQAEQSLVETQERLELALAAADVGTWVWDIPQGTITADNRLAAMFEVDPDEAARGAPLESYLAAVHPADLERVAASISEIASRGGRHEIEQRLLRKDGTLRWIVARGECQYDDDGRPVRFPAATVDITELKQAEQSRELIARELAHRIKNICSVVNGLIALSARSHPDAKPFAESLRERLTALAVAHDYIRAQGPDSPLPERGNQTVLGLLRSVLAPYLQHGSERIAVDGADAPLGPASATALALIIHEQATNAVKYGALSTQSGIVTIDCDLSGDLFLMQWKETGGPRILKDPERTGFGSELAMRSASGQLGGTIAYDWASEGLTMRMSISAAKLQR
jgi:PAS domain S-box-containing protein